MQTSNRGAVSRRFGKLKVDVGAAVPKLARMNIAFYSAVFAVWFVMVVLAIVVGWTPSQDVVAFLTAGGLAGYMQGGGTIVAATFAIMAYVTWRRPDIARRDSETAQLVMRTASRLESAALDARHVSYLFPSLHEEDKKEMLVSAFVRLQGRVTPDDLAHLRHQINDANTYMAEVRKIFGQKAAVLLLHLISLCRVVEQDYSMLPSLVEPNDMFVGSSAYMEWLERSAMVLGQLQTTIGPESPEDGYAVSLRSSGDELRLHLSQWL